MHHFWYTARVKESRDKQPLLTVVFYRTAAGAEPVRNWLLELKRDDRRTVGFDQRLRDLWKE